MDTAKVVSDGRPFCLKRKRPAAGWIEAEESRTVFLIKRRPHAHDVDVEDEDVEDEDVEEAGLC